jgi:hypothetical protein
MDSVSARRREWSDRRVAPGLIVVLTAAVVVRWVLPAVFGSAPFTWDAAGHLLAAETVRDRFLPRATGWDPSLFTGWPQGQFYPPFTHWLIAVVGLVLPIEAAYSLVVGGAAALLPWSVWRAARARRLRPGNAALASLFFTALAAGTPTLLRSDVDPGGTLHSVFEVGLAAQGVGMTLFFLAAAAFPAALGRRALIVPAALLLAVNVVNHLVAGAAAALLFLADATIRVSAAGRRRAVVARAASVAGLALGLTAWWWIPRVADADLQHIWHLPSEAGPMVSIALAAGLASAALRGATPRRFFLQAGGPAVLAAGLAVLMVAGDVRRSAGHFYRFAVFAAAAGLMVAAAGPRSRLAKTAAGLVAGALLAAFLIVAGPTASRRTPPEVVVPAELGSGDRILAATASGHDFSAHFLEAELPRRSKAGALLGLFVESSPLSTAILALSRAVVFDPYAWGVPLDLKLAARLASGARGPAAADDAGEDGGSKLRRLLAEFGVTHLLTDRAPPPGFCEGEAPIVARIPSAASSEPGDEFEMTDGRRVFRMHRLALRARLAEPVVRPMIAFESDDPHGWDAAVERSVFDGGPSDPLLVAARPGVVLTSASENVEVECRSEDDGMRFTLDIRSTKPEPVIVKTAWHPCRRARDAEGRDLPVDRAAPGFCLVRGKGAVTLSFERRPFEVAAEIASLLGLGAAVALHATTRRRRRNSRHPEKCDR